MIIIDDNDIKKMIIFDDRGHFWSKRARPGQFWSKRSHWGSKVFFSPQVVIIICLLGTTNLVALIFFNYFAYSSFNVT